MRGRNEPPIPNVFVRRSVLLLRERSAGSVRRHETRKGEINRMRQPLEFLTSQKIASIAKVYSAIRYSRTFPFHIKTAIKHSDREFSCDNRL